MSNTIDMSDDGFDHGSPFTIVILGPPRSGTSMTAGIVRLLGIYMGDCNEKNNEDPRFNKSNDIESIRELIGRNNGERAVWGWKEPSSHMYYEKVVDVVRTPFFIVNYRNILSSVASKLKHTDDGGDPDRLTLAYANHYVRISRLLAGMKAPKLYVNYEKVLEDPIAFADDLSMRFLGRPLDARMNERIMEYCAPGSYKVMSAFA